MESIEDDGASDFHAPQLWVDPISAQEAISRIADEFDAVDLDNAEVYESNAANYTDQLEDVHEQFEEQAGNANQGGIRSSSSLMNHSSQSSMSTSTKGRMETLTD